MRKNSDTCVVPTCEPLPLDVVADGMPGQELRYNSLHNSTTPPPPPQKYTKCHYTAMCKTVTLLPLSFVSQLNLRFADIKQVCSIKLP